MEGYFLILELQSFSFNFYLLSISAIETLFYKLIRILLKNIWYPLKIIAYKITDRRK